MSQRTIVITVPSDDAQKFWSEIHSEMFDSLEGENLTDMPRSLIPDPNVPWYVF